MSEIIILAKRNLKVYFRDRLSVFFSCLSSLILIVLFFIFIKKTYVGKMPDGVDSNVANALVIAQLVGGVITLTMFSLSLGALGGLVDDFSTGKISGLIVKRIPKFKIVLSYVISSWLLALVISLAESLILFLYQGISTSIWFSFGTICLYLLILLAYSLVAAVMMFSIVSIIKSSSAFGAVNGIITVFFGFLCGIYMPYSIIGSGASIVGSLIPATTMSSWLKELLVKDVLKSQGIPDAASEAILYQFGGEPLGFLGLDIPNILVLLIHLVILGGVLFLVIRSLKKKL